MYKTIKPYIANSLFLLIVLSIFSIPFSHADIIYLNNGNKVEGIVLEEGEDTVKVKLKIGTMTFSTADIEAIEKSTEEEKVVLEEKWQDQKEKSVAEYKKIGARSKQTVETAPATEEKTVKQKKQTKQRVPARINWVRNFDQALKKAKSSGKPIMIDFYTDWCGWCTKLDKDTFSDKRIRNLSTNFVCVKIDADKNKSLTQKYGVSGYPTTVFLDSSGKKIGNIGGYLPPDGYEREMKKYIN